MVRVSAITPTYNRAAFLDGAIGTALGQTYDDIEIVVVNDGSTDDTREVLGRYAHDDRVRVLHNGTNRGMTESWNRGVRAANGEFLCILDDDDRWHPEKVAKQVALMDRLDEDYAVVYTGGVVTENGTITQTFVPERRGRIYPAVLGSWRLSPHSSHMVRRAAFEAVGGFDTAFESGGDWDLSIRLAREYEFEYIAESLVERLSHDNNVSARPEHAEEWGRIAEKYRAELRKYPALEQELYANWASIRGWHAINDGQRRRAVRHYRCAFGYEPTAYRLALVAAAMAGPTAFGVLGSIRRAVHRSVADYGRPDGLSEPSARRV